MDLKILQWNCRGIYRKILELKHHIANLSHTPDILALQETHLVQKYTPRIRNYTLIRKDRDVHGGGVCLFIKNNLPYNEVCLGNIGAIEAQCIAIQDVRIINVYIPPNRRPPQSHFERLFAARTSRSVFIGDFNAHHPLWSEAVTNSNGRNLYHLIDSCNLVVVNTTNPTRIDLSRRQHSLIDLTIATSSLASLTETLVSDDLFGSDHFTITTNIRTSITSGGAW